MTATTVLNPTRVRQDFPILEREVRPGVQVIYLDSTATSQKPSSVLQAMEDYYRRQNANIHRGVHTLAEEATQAYEEARKKVAVFIHAPSSRQLVYTRNTTEAINLVAYSWGRSQLKAGDLVVLTEMEHHSNIVPWQILAAERGIQIRYVPVMEDGLLDMNAYHDLLALKPRLVAFTHMSNVLGTITPAKQIIADAHQAGALALVDGAQSVPHLPVDVADLDADFLAFSAHKMCGPTGIGVLYGKTALLESMPPFMGGGDMIRRVTFEGFTSNELPYKFEAGTPAIAEAIGFGAAVDYLSQIGMDAVAVHEQEITAYAMDRLSEISGLQILGPVDAHQKGGVVSFTLQGIHPHDVAQILDEDGIAVRAGHHCAMPLHQKLGLPASTRASFYLYNTREEVDALAVSIEKVKNLFG
ncbi:MAG: cysteine desulfurase [Anaerolineaceae bacterium]|nr:cysteine desulfurase [Anaerolineaceae bacterium]